MNKKNSILHIIGIIFKTAFCAAPFCMVFILITGLCHGMIKVSETVALQYFLEGITEYIAGQSKSRILFRLGILAMTLAGGYLFEGIHNAMMEVASFKLEAGMTERLRKKQQYFRQNFMRIPKIWTVWKKREKEWNRGHFC